MTKAATKRKQRRDRHTEAEARALWPRPTPATLAKNTSAGALLAKLAEHQTIGTFLAGIPLWPRCEMLVLERLQGKSVCDLTKDEASEASCAARIAAVMAESEGKADAAARLRTLLPMLEQRGDVSHSMTPRELESYTRKEAGVYRVAADLCRQATEEALTQEELRELGEIVAGWLASPAEMQSLTLAYKEIDARPAIEQWERERRVRGQFTPLADRNPRRSCERRD